MFFQVKERTEEQLDTYEQITALVSAVLHAHCPEHRHHHHLLYTTNAKLQQYAEAKEFYQQYRQNFCAIGQFAKEAYEVAVKKHSTLYTFIRAYTNLTGNPNHEHWNHTFRFSKEKIAALYAFFMAQQPHMNNLQLEQSFFQTLNEELLPIFHQID